MNKLVSGIVAGMLLTAIHPAHASYGYYVGSELTEDGSVMLGGSGEEVSSHWLRIEADQDHADDATISVGVTEDAVIPGERIEIPQVETTHAFISMDYSNWEGFPPPLTNGGLNEHQVAARDIWSPSREELVEMTPTPQTGPSYSDLARIVMQRATSARNAVKIIGEVIAEHGYSTYGGNSHLFADAEEGWVLIEFAGGEGLWAAQRLGPDDVRVSYPGYIGEIPNDCADNHEEAMCSDNFVAFAEEQGWYDPEGKDTINVHEVYGDQDAPMRNDAIEFMEDHLRSEAPLTLRDFLDIVRHPSIADHAAGYGQAAHLREGFSGDMATLWVAPSSSVVAPFIPWRVGVTEVPVEFRQHRYLTRASDDTYTTPEFQLQEATPYAFRLFKRTLYYACQGDENPHYDEVIGAFRAFEDDAIDEQEDVERIARVLYDQGEEALARTHLTRYSLAKARQAMAMGNALVDSLEMRTKLHTGIPQPDDDADLQREEYNMIRCGEHPGEPPL